MRGSLVLGLGLLLAGLVQAGSEQAPASNLYRKVENEGTLNYLLHLPAGYEASGQRYPLLFFLHGIAQKGNGSPGSIKKVAVDGPFRTMRDGYWDESLPLVVVGPQSGGIQPWWRGEEVRKVLDHVMDTYRIDPARRYLTGISMGGRSIWWLAKNFHDEFAAMVPTSGWAGDVRKSCEGFRHLAVWAFHGANDPLIGLSAGSKPIDALTACAPPFEIPPRLTVLDAGHGQWYRVYQNKHGATNIGNDGSNYSDIYRWMLSFSRR